MQAARSWLVCVLAGSSGLALGLSGCASGGGGERAALSADSTRANASLPLDEVRRLEAEQAERKRAALAAAATEATESNPQDPTADADALKRWMERVQADGLVDQNNATKPPRTPRQPPEKSALVFGAPAEQSGTEAPATPDADATPAPAETLQAVPTVAATIEPGPSAPSPAPEAPLTNSRPLSELTRLVMARAAGQSIDEARLSALEKNLTPEERSFYEQWKSLNQAVAGENAGDVNRLREAAGRFAQAANAWAPLSIPTLALCSRVEGFGLYNELKRAADQGPTRTYQFLAGRKSKFIVYCEVGGFAARAASKSGRDGFEVELEQDLTLYAAAKDRDVAAWRRTGQRVTDFSRNPRKDFFVVQIVELPENLSVGAYTLKVRLIDRGSDSGAQAEALVNIDIVADASALR